MSSGSRNPSPISISSPRLTTTSRPAASAVAASTQSGRAVADDVHCFGVRHGGSERRQGSAAAPARRAGRTSYSTST